MASASILDPSLAPDSPVPASRSSPPLPPSLAQRLPCAPHPWPPRPPSALPALQTVWNSLNALTPGLCWMAGGSLLGNSYAKLHYKFPAWLGRPAPRSVSPRTVQYFCHLCLHCSESSKVCLVPTPGAAHSSGTSAPLFLKPGLGAGIYFGSQIKGSYSFPGAAWMPVCIRPLHLDAVRCPGEPGWCS